MEDDGREPDDQNAEGQTSAGDRRLVRLLIVLVFEVVRIASARRRRRGGQRWSWRGGGRVEFVAILRPSGRARRGERERDDGSSGSLLRSFLLDAVELLLLLSVAMGILLMDQIFESIGFTGDHRCHVQQLSGDTGDLQIAQIIASNTLLSETQRVGIDEQRQGQTN